ncbi:MAG: DnaD domain protein [Clostridia bacterium]|nr:DnaD domain protein [Clostridia bacterium]NCC42232.1 DnaD domain protein [Clostridia bacterium]
MRLSLHNGSSSGVTIISNVFIDHYLPLANGEFVKIYLYLLRCLKGGDKNLDLSSVADIFSCTETDIMRALRYWETHKLVVLSGKGDLTSIDFLEPMAPARTARTQPAAAPQKPVSAAPAASKPSFKPASAKPAASAASSDSAASTASVASSSAFSGSAAQAPVAEAAFALEPKSRPYASSGTATDTYAASASANHRLSADRIKELKANEDVRQMLFIAEQYLGSTLSRSVTDELLYIYEELHFSVDLIDYLIEYCVSKGSRDIHYIKKVAFSWHENGIDTVTRAKQDTTTFHKNYFTILKAFGVTNRNPVSTEITMIDHWMKDYGFTMDILTEACARTVQATGKANFRYADKILSGWKEKGVRHLTDIQALDTLHRQLQVDRAQQQTRQKSSGNGKSASNKFNNFQQRNYDYNELENQLLKK